MQNNLLILLLCRYKTNRLIELNNFFCNNNLASVIVKENPKLPKTYYGLNRIKKGITAWETAFYYLENTNQKYNYVWLLEDDVYSTNFETYIKFFHYYDSNNNDLIAGDIESKQISQNWEWWADAEIVAHKHNYRSYNPICRLSIDLINLILDFRKKNQRFCFHETLFASLCVDNNLSFLNYAIDANPYMGLIRYRPCYNKTDIIDHKIYHPVK